MSEANERQRWSVLQESPAVPQPGSRRGRKPRERVSAQQRRVISLMTEFYRDGHLRTQRAIAIEAGIREETLSRWMHNAMFLAEYESAYVRAQRRWAVRMTERADSIRERYEQLFGEVDEPCD